MWRAVDARAVARRDARPIFHTALCVQILSLLRVNKFARVKLESAFHFSPHRAPPEFGVTDRTYTQTDIHIHSYESDSQLVPHTFSHTHATLSNASTSSQSHAPPGSPTRPQQAVTRPGTGNVHGCPLTTPNRPSRLPPSDPAIHRQADRHTTTTHPHHTGSATSQSL